jgi:uncharacterized membrane protein
MKHVAMTDTAFTSDTNLGPSARRRRRPLHRMLVAFSAAYFAGALVTDLVYWQMPDVMWERFSIWLIFAGLVTAGLATIAYVIDLAGRRRIERPAWPRAIGYALAVVLSVVNAFVHSRDGYTAVVPSGLALSALVVVVLILTAWFGVALTNRRRFGG